jgi:ABC-type transport system involved in multi-copper enzyme maturation permease subunit
MSPPRFLRLLRLDLHLLRRHGALTSIGIFTVLICLMVMLGLHVVMGELQEQPELLALGDPLGQTGIPGAELTWQGMAAIALWIRSLPFCLPLILIVLTGRVVSNAVRDHTIREELVRPLSRSWLLIVRFTALSVCSMASLLLCVLLCLAFGKIMGVDAMQATMIEAQGGDSLGGESPAFVSFMLGIGLLWISDMTIIVMAMLLSLLIQPTSRVILILVLGFVLDFFTRIFLRIYVEIVQSMDVAEKQRQALPDGENELTELSRPQESDKGQLAEEMISWFPGEALDMWQQWPSDSWNMSPLVATGVIFVACFSLSIVRFRRMDII